MGLGCGPPPGHHAAGRALGWRPHFVPPEPSPGEQPRGYFPYKTLWGLFRTNGYSMVIYIAFYTPYTFLSPNSFSPHSSEASFIRIIV